MTLYVGDVVTVGRACLGNPEGARAVVVEAYELPVNTREHVLRPGWMLLFENGAADGFSPGDCDLFKVERIDHVPALAGYRFANMLTLQRDYRSGLFAAALEPPSLLRQMGGV